jgi:dienelactone hydrolase
MVVPPAHNEQQSANSKGAPSAKQAERPSAYTSRVLRLLIALSAAALACASIACSSDGDDPPPTSTPVPIASYGEPGPHGVGVTTLQLVDTSRPLAPNGDFPGAPERAIPVEVWYPADTGSENEVRDAPLSGGPYPLIVFAHGFLSSRMQSASYTRHLATHGYIVAAPEFPGSNGNAPGGPRLGAVIDQPADVSFVIEELLRRNDDIDGPFAGAIDAERIGMTGHSLGGLTTVLTMGGDGRDERIRAGLPISPLGCFLGDDHFAGVTTPLVVMGGSEELIVDPSSIRHAYDLANAPKYFVEVGGADHIKFADVDLNDRDVGGLDIVTSQVGTDQLIADAIAIAESAGGNAGTCLGGSGPKGEEYISGDRQREIMRMFGALFFDAYLRGDEGAKATLQGDPAEIAPEAHVEYE